MTNARKAIFAAVRAAKADVFNEVPERIGILDGILDDFGIPRDEVFNRQEFMTRYVNLKAPAIDSQDIARAANRLGVSVKHIEMLRKVESNGKSFDNKGRPTILPEPHIFYRLTNGAYGVTHYSYPKWGTRSYPSTTDARWTLLADMAEKDEYVALQSASWGLFQVMGFNWKVCGYQNPHAFADAMAEDEDNHLEACVEFILAEGLADELAACRAGSPESCRAFAQGYNGPGYAKNNYHVKMSEALK